MLSEIFENLEIDEEVITELPLCKPEEFRPQVHTETWFTDNSKEETYEILSHRAFHAYHTGDFALSYKLFNQMLKRGNHNRVHQVGIYESIMRSIVKMNPLPVESESLLESYKGIVNEYGVQIQYWNSTALLLKQIPSRSTEYLKTVILLSSTVDSPDHWKLFGENPHINIGPNFVLAFRTRILALIEFNLIFSNGFVVDLLKKEKEKIEEQIKKMNEPPERIDLARTAMATDLLRVNKLRELSEDIKRPAHDCRCQIGKFKTDEECSKIVVDFMSRFSFMFEEMKFI